MRTRALLLVAVLPAALSTLGCSAKSKWEVDLSYVNQQDASRSGGRLSRELNPDATAQREVDPAALRAVGVRHDLIFSPSAKHEETCSCLAVAVGPLNDARFAWQNGAPTPDKDLMAVAISSRGVGCQGGPADENARRPSISAVDREGADVVIEVEELHGGRPLATGAVFVKPGPGGGVYVRPRGRNLPYARPAAGDRACRALAPQAAAGPAPTF